MKFERITTDEFNRRYKGKASVDVITASSSIHIDGKVRAEKSDPKERRAKEPNKTECRFLQYAAFSGIATQAEPLEFEAVTLKLAPGMRYTPDFFQPSQLTFYEIKGGHIWDDARDRFRFAREKYPCFRFRMFQWSKGQWRELYRENEKA